MKGYEIEQHEAHAAIVITSSCMHGWQRGLSAHRVQSRIEGLRLTVKSHCSELRISFPTEIFLK